MHYGMVTDRHIIANRSTILFIGTMYASAILHIYFVTHFNKIYITPHHSVKPKTAINASYYIAYNGGIGCNKIVVTKLRVLIFYRKYYRHKYF